MEPRKSAFCKRQITSLSLLLGATSLSLGICSAKAQATYTLKPTPKTVAWGYYDAKATPVLRIKSGDAVC
jgi:hypothetical protein